MPERVTNALKAVGLDKPFRYPVDKLSMGQKYRLLMAALLVMEPRLLILDEPGAQLDPEGLERLQNILCRLKAAGVAVVLCEHRPEPLLGVIDAFWQLDGNGTLGPGRCRKLEEGVAPEPQQGLAQPGEDLLRATDLAFAGMDKKPVWAEVSFAVYRGQRVAVTGLNGTGKTTLLRCLAGFLKPSSGEVRILGGAPDPYRLRGRLGCLFQNPQKQLFENTVREEVAFPLKRFGLSGGDAALRVEETLEACGIAHLAALSPHKLSYGQKHLVALASVLAPRPELLLLDDPLAGLDAKFSQMVMELLSRRSAEEDMALVWTSHDPGAWPGWADQVLHLHGGRHAAL
jgi:energy-coupling factor transport system ATP-binding protein